MHIFQQSVFLFTKPENKLRMWGWTSAVNILPACTLEGSIILPVLMASTIGWPRCSMVLLFCITPTYLP